MDLSSLRPKVVENKVNLILKQPVQEVEKIDYRSEEEKKEVVPGEIAFYRTVCNHFFRELSGSFYTNGVMKNDERAKNKYLAKLFYRKVVRHELDVEFEEGVNQEEIYAKLADQEYWKSIITFMFKYADANILKYYTQTINGVFSFYFKHYARLKKQVNSPTLTGDELQILGKVRKWKKEDAINCFYLYVVKLYRYLAPIKNYDNKEIYYKYCGYFQPSSIIPKIQKVVLDNDSLLRGLLLQFRIPFQEFCILKGFELDTIFDYGTFSQLCEEKGVDYEDSVLVGKQLNDIISDAMEKFTKVQ